jgi:putative transposase
VSVRVHSEQEEPSPATGAPIGVDLGIKTVAVLSDGRTFENPKALCKNSNTLKRAAPAHSRKAKGSANRTKAKVRVAKQHARIANIRCDALHKATSAIIARTRPDDARPSTVVCEDLNISGMLKNRRLSRAGADMGRYEFERQIEYKAKSAGVRVVFASPWELLRKTCHACGWKDERLTLADRVFVCHACGTVSTATTTPRVIW